MAPFQDSVCCSLVVNHFVPGNPSVATSLSFQDLKHKLSPQRPHRHLRNYFPGRNAMSGQFPTIFPELMHSRSPAFCCRSCKQTKHELPVLNCLASVFGMYPPIRDCVYISCLQPKEELTDSLATTHSWAAMNAGQALTVATKTGTVWQRNVGYSN